MTAIPHVGLSGAAFAGSCSVLDTHVCTDSARFGNPLCVQGVLELLFGGA
jgi:hypothetical protein